MGEKLLIWCNPLPLQMRTPEAQSVESSCLKPWLLKFQRWNWNLAPRMPASCSFSDTQAFGPASFGELVLPYEATDVLELQMNWVMVTKRGFPGGSDGKESACNARDSDLIPVLERSPGEGNGYPLQYSCLENSMVSEAWRVSPWGHNVRHNWATNFHSHPKGIQASRGPWGGVCSFWAFPLKSHVHEQVPSNPC